MVEAPSSRHGPFSWLRKRPLLGYKYPFDYVLDLRDVSRKLDDMLASLGNGTATEDERKQLEQARSHVRSALRRFEDAQRNIDVAW